MNNIRHYREQTGLTQTEFANLVGVSQGTISDWERGIVEPRREKYRRMVQVLDAHGVRCSQAQLMGLDEVSPKYA